MGTVRDAAKAAGKAATARAGQRRNATMKSALRDPAALQLLSSLGSEATLAQRIEEERRARGWSQERLSKEMRAIGCHLPQSAISKIEQPPAGGRRAITVDEAIAFAKVFDVSLFELVLSGDAFQQIRLQRTLKDGADSYDERVALDRRIRALLRTARWLAGATTETLEEQLAAEQEAGRGDLALARFISDAVAQPLDREGLDALQQPEEDA